MKIVEGLPKPKNSPNGGGAPTATKPTPSRDPKTPNPSTPPHLLAMKGHCYSSNIGNKYKYEVCPFENVTQLDTAARWNPFYGILGIWDGWKEGTNYTIGSFTDGTMCGTKARTVEVHFLCGEGEARISDVNEPETCTYTIEMHATEICNNDNSITIMELQEREEVVGEKERITAGETPIKETFMEEDEKNEKNENVPTKKTIEELIEENHMEEDERNEENEKAAKKKTIEELMKENNRLREEVVFFFRPAEKSVGSKLPAPFRGRRAFAV